MLVDCGFCASINDLARFGDVVYQDDHCAVLLHPDSAVAGHAMIVWRRHVENLSNLGAAERAHFFNVHTRAERVLLAETKCDRAILLKLGIMTPHLHMHIYPFAATATREDVMRAIDAKSSEQRTEGFIERVRAALTAESA